MISTYPHIRQKPSLSNPPLRHKQAHYLGWSLVLLLAAATQALPSSPAPTQSEAAALCNRIVKQAEPLCWRLSPEQGVLHFVVAPLPVSPTDPADKAMWTVECFDAHDKPLLYLLWNAAVQRPFAISRLTQKDVSPSPFLATPPQAILAARECAVRLRLLTSREAETANLQTRFQQGVWCVSLRGSQGTLQLWMDERGGTLTHVFFSEPVKTGRVAGKCPQESVLPSM